MRIVDDGSGGGVGISTFNLPLVHDGKASPFNGIAESRYIHKYKV